MHCKCCCQTNIPGYPLIWIEQDKGLICSGAKPLLFMALRYFFFPLFWSVKLNRTIPGEQLNELTPLCTMHMQPRRCKNNLLIALVKMPPCRVRISPTKVRRAVHAHGESLLWSYQGFLHARKRKWMAHDKVSVNAARHLEVCPWH